MSIVLKRGDNKELRFEVFTTRSKAKLGSIREFYSDGKGNMLPGKSGMTLKIEEFPDFVKNLRKLYDDLNACEDGDAEEEETTTRKVKKVKK